MGDTPARIIRTIHDQQNRFFLFSRETAQNTSLSYEALGVLAYLLSKPDDWTVRVSDLQKRAHGKKAHYGRGAIAAIMQELRTAGYAELKPIRDAKTGIVSGTEYWIYETPRPAETTEQPDFRRSEKPTVEKPAPIEDTDSLQETEKDSAPKNGAGATSQKKTATPKPRDEYFDVIADVWQTTAGGFIGGVKKMMLGKATGRGQYADGNFDKPVTDPQEIRDFGVYAWKRARALPSNGKSPALPVYAVTIQKWFYDFRDERDSTAAQYPAGYVPVAERTSFLQSITWYEGCEPASANGNGGAHE